MTTHRHDAGDPAAEALERVDEALSQAIDQLSLYLDQNHPPDERSSPADLLAAVLHRYAQRQHHAGYLPLATLGEVIEEVLEARENSDRHRAEYREKYGERAGDLLASLADVAAPIPPRFEDLCDADEALRRYRGRVDRHFGEGAGLPRQKVTRNAEMLSLYYRALEDAIGLYMREPERFSIVTSPSSPDKTNVFEAVAPKYGINPGTLYNQYDKFYSTEDRAKLAEMARKKRQRQPRN